MEDIVKDHVEQFGVEPVVIGLYPWDTAQRISEAIEDGEPYNEKEDLSPLELERFERGDLLT